jgi:phosphate butyryltransferase
MGHDAASVEALIAAVEEGVAEAVIVGPEAALKETLTEMGRSLPEGIEVIDREDPVEAAREAVRLVSSGEATTLMKGLLKTSLFQKAILDKEIGLRSGRVLSHVAVILSPAQDRLVAVTDGGMNIKPGKEELVQIIQNAADVVNSLEIGEPLAALLAAIEVPNEKIPETILLDEIARSWDIEGISVAGPIAVDGAMVPEAAAIKGMTGPVPGRANILVAPDLNCGNIFAKSLMYMAGAEVGGLIAGAAAPVVMLSRSDTAEAKLNSLALGVVVGGR